MGGRSTTAPLDAVELPRLRARTHRAFGDRYLSRRFWVLICATAAHVAIVHIIVSMPGHIPESRTTDPMISVFVRPRIVVNRELPLGPPHIAEIRIPANSPMTAGPVPDSARPTLTVIGVGTMVPYPEQSVVSAEPFVRQAGLLPGEGATVVLRVEVMGTGELSRIEIDVSGGTPEIDQAAIAYANVVPWIGGMIDGKPATMWIRWGVRLQA